jgi:hypothetical protein
MSGRNRKFFISDRNVMAKVYEARDRLVAHHSLCVKRKRDAVDFTQIDECLDSFEAWASHNFEYMCEDCIYAATRDASSNFPSRGGHQPNEDDDRETGAHSSVANKMCSNCEEVWLEQLTFAWVLYEEIRTNRINWAPVKRPAPPAWGDSLRLPGGYFIWCDHAIPGYTKEEARKIKEDNRHCEYHMDKIVAQETGKDWQTRRTEIEYKHGKSGVRKELLRSNIKIVLSAHIREDGKRLALWEAGSEDRSSQVRAEIRTEFISRTTKKYGESVLGAINPSDISNYCIEVEAGGNEDFLWNSVLKKYDFDQTTDSCLYFIKQGPATKIGITNSLDLRFAQIKTSAAFPCEIANVVYTHFGYELEQTLHHRLRRFNSHLEWFILPPGVEARLFTAKSRNEIEEFLRWFEEEF